MYKKEFRDVSYNSMKEGPLRADNHRSYRYATSTKVEKIVPASWSVASRHRRDSYVFVMEEDFDETA